MIPVYNPITLNVYELFLIQEGYIMRTSGGREVTEAAYKQ
ncbi:Holliday junction DNA helicase RuvB C-terminal domain-containing protein [Pedobacter sp. WC2501]